LALTLDFFVKLEYIYIMTIVELKEIIALNIDAAEAGSLQAQGQVIEAQAEVERLEALERAEFGATREELTDFSMLTDEELKGGW
jgi:hypothetical protein